MSERDTEVVAFLRLIIEVEEAIQIIEAKQRQPKRNKAKILFTRLIGAKSAA